MFSNKRCHSDFLKKIDEHPGTNYEELSQSYSNLEKMVSFIDNQLSVFVFWVTTYVAITMCLMISYIFHSKTLFILTDFCSLLNSSVCFLTATTSAAFVSNASESVRKKCKSLPENHSHNFVCNKKELYLSVWKIVPIRRSFILAAFGTIVTYVILFDDIGDI
ncbi:hypothetical protein TNCV_4337381 [Trichonephila clavipes]|nr:hypothetical protein TNCV_4337381 [Trichonephila clavipes]